MRKKNPNSIWIIIRLLFRQRLTAGALVCVTNSTCVLLTSRAGLHLCTSRPQARILKQQTLLCLRRNAEQHWIFFFFFAVCFVCHKVTVSAFSFFFFYHPIHSTHYASAVAHMIRPPFTFHTPALKNLESLGRLNFGPSVFSSSTSGLVLTFSGENGSSISS